MKISNSTHHELPISIRSNPLTDKPVMIYGTLTQLSHDVDTVEISPTARQLAASDIVNHSAIYFGTAQINDSLNRLLNGQSSGVKEAVYGIIQSNMITQVTREEERAALLELGLAQAQFISDNYMNDGDATEFMNTMRLIGAISQTGTTDAETNGVHYRTPPQRPIGAPEDYIHLTDLMQRFEPNTCSQLQEAIVNEKDWGGILLSFAKKAATRQDWVKEYRKEAARQTWDVSGENRFRTASTNSLAGFVRDIQDSIPTTGIVDARFLTNNLEAFARTLGRLRP